MFELKIVDQVSFMGGRPDEVKDPAPVDIHEVAMVVNPINPLAVARCETIPCF